MADSPQRTDDDLHAEVKVLLTEEIRRARRRVGERSAAERRVLDAAKAWRDGRGKDTPTSVYLEAVRALVAAVDAWVGTGEQG